MNHRARVVCAGVLICAAAVGTVHAQTGNRPRQPRQFDNNNDEGGSVHAMCLPVSSSTLPGGVLAVVTVPGPPGAINPWFEIRNFGTDRIRYAIVNGFGGRAGKGVVFDTAGVRIQPPGGSLRIEHPGPTEGGMGPLMLAFSGFDSGGCAGVATTLGTWEDPEYQGGAEDIVGARVDLVFEGGLRGSGDFQLCNGAGHVRDRFHQQVDCTPGSVVAVVVE